MFSTPESITVVIPCFNSAQTIRAAIDSIAHQTLLPSEVIVVDDASNDESIHVIQCLQSIYRPEWLKFIRMAKNDGAASARNIGWEAASGSHIAFLDTDDVWHSRKLEIQWRQFQADPDLALSAHSFRFPWDDDATVDSNVDIVVISKSQILWRNPFVTPSVMLRKDLPFRFQKGKRHMEDHLLWMEIVFSGHSVKKMNLPLATINKPQFGSSGLSSQLWSMELGELQNYLQLHKKRYISAPTTMFFLIFSLIKFVRRLAIVALRRLKELFRSR